MEVTTEAWRVKACFNPKHWVTGKHGRGDENVVKDDQQEEDRRPQVRETTPKEPKPKKERQITLCFHNKKKKFSQHVTEPMARGRSLASACNDNLCTCCCLLARYIKEIFRCVYCLTNCAIPERLCFLELLSAIVQSTCALCTDVCVLIKNILKFCCGKRR